jgi:hypothetical protein
MNILHWIAVEADSEEQALTRVEDILDDGSVARWSDYHKVGFDDDPKVVSFKEQPDQFYRILSNIINYRQEQVIKYIGRMKFSPMELLGKGIKNLLTERVVPNPFLSHQLLDMDLYVLEKIVALLNDTYIPESYFYDAVAYTASIDQVESRTLENPDKQYLVAVRFHV